MAELSMWVITGNPSDFPGKFVARKHVIGRGFTRATQLHHVADSLDEARTHVPAGLFRLKRQPHDDPAIVESWI